jgi:protein TonB
LLAHALFCAFCLLLIQRSATRPTRHPVWVELTAPPNRQDLAKRRDDDTRRRVVQSNAGRETQEAAPNAFLGEKTRVVDLQTVNIKKQISMAKPGHQVAEHSRPKSEAAAKPVPKTALSSLGLAILPEARRKGATEALAKDAPQWANIGSEAQDYVQGIKESDRTALNTREYLYFGYHQRIRQRLELEWTRLLKTELIRFYRSGRHLASDAEYSTRLLVILNGRGEITRIKVVEMSGTQELDSVAVQAFNKAGPFPNPPKGLIRNGEVEVPWELKLRS